MTEVPTPLEPTDADGHAARVLAELEAGRPVDVEAEALALSEGAPRDTFRQLVSGVLAIRGVLPVQVRPGVLLGGRYRIREQLGSGGMGKVFNAHDEQLEREVAVKVLAVLGTSGLDPVAQLRKEARLLARLEHPGIVAVHEVAADGDVHYIVMDRVRGVSLATVLACLRRDRGQPAQEGDVAPADARHRERLLTALPGGRDAARPERWPSCVARLMAGLCDALAAAHAADLVHRDVKPGNVLLREDGSTVLLDFGLAGVRDEAPGAVTRGLFGSAAYLAPEQASAGAVGVDPRTDVHQLGALMHELLVLRRAFHGRTATEILARITEGQAPRPRQVDAGVPRDLEAVCLKAMARNPSERYATAADLRDDLLRWLDGRRPRAARAGPLVGLVHDARSALRRQRLGLLAAAGLAVGALLGLWSAGDDPDVVVEPLAFTPADESLRFGDDLLAVRPGDALGARFELAEPRWVWALSVWGGGDRPERMAPMLSRRVPSGARSPADWGRALSASAAEAPGGAAILDRSRFGLRLAAGEHVLLSTSIAESAAPGSSEGLWIFTSPEREAELELWFEALWDRGRAGADAGVALADARALFDPLGEVVRGEPLALGAGDLARVGRLLTAATVLGEQPWPDGQLQRFAFLETVAPR